MTNTIDAPGFVLDGSVALAWHFPDKSSPYADSVGAALPAVGAAVPLL